MTNEFLSVKKREALQQGKSIDSVYQNEQEIKELALEIELLGLECNSCIDMDFNISAIRQTV